MPFSIVRNDITRVEAEAIVNTANPEPVIGGGTDSAIYRAAGAEELLKLRMAIGRIEPGHAAWTPALKLPAKFIIHTVSPRWQGGGLGELETLRSCYAVSLSMAAELRCASVAFPLIGTGAYGLPKDLALNAALSEIGKFLLNHDMDVILVVFDRNSFRLSKELFADISEFIDESRVERLRQREYGSLLDRWPRRGTASRMSKPSLAQQPALGGTLEDALKWKRDGFREKLFRLIDERGMTDVEVYKRANIDRKVFSKIRSTPGYTPKKTTALALAVALRLDITATEDLLSRAGLALSPSSELDLIVAYFITHGSYDIFEINAALFERDQPLLGSSLK